MLRTLTLVAAILSPTCAYAQTIWTVDQQGGPGSQFTDIQPAVDAAQDGDRILVRAGAYSGFQIDGKGLAVLGEAGALIGGSFVSVRNTSVTQPVVLADLSGVESFGIFLPLISGCAGQVLMERVEGSNWTITSGADVRLNSCRVSGGCNVTDSRLTATDSRFTAGPFALTPPPALRLTTSEATLSRTSAAGQSQMLRSGSSSAIEVRAPSTLLLTDDGSHVIGAGTGNRPLPAIVGDGAVIRDPRVRVLGSSGAPGLAVGSDLVQYTPSLQVIGAPVGSTIEVDLAGMTGETWWLVFGFPGPLTTLQGIRGGLGLGVPVISISGVFGPNAVHRSILAGPGLPPGIRLTWQAVTTDGQGGFVLSNHATYTRTR